MELDKKWSNKNMQEQISPSMKNMFQAFDTRLLDQAGLNRQAVFNIEDLPADVAATIEPGQPGNSHSPYRQLILIGHAGRTLWDAVRNAGIASADPIDDFTIRTVRQWFAQCQPGCAYEIVYPGPRLIGLQRLGQLAGWHHPSPFMIGIDPKWGTWYAYRAVVLAETRFAPTIPVASDHPCDACAARVCAASCPGGAIDEGRFELGKCLAYRRREDSACKATCLARIACPVGAEHRYTDEQLQHTYSISMRAIERFY